jgi:hypothetical protein
MSKGRKFLKLSFADQQLLAQCVLLLPLMALALKTIRLRRLQRLLVGNSPNPNSSSQESISRVCRLAQMVNRAAAIGFFPANCLVRSLTLWWLLRRRGILGDLRIGVRKTEGEFQAHAWLEYQGKVVNDVAEIARQYSPFADAFSPAVCHQRANINWRSLTD